MEIHNSMTDSFETTFAKSRELYEQAKTLYPDGVTHDLRHLTPFPIYVESASGSHKRTVEGHDLIDYWSGHGSLLLGHCHPDVVRAVQQQMTRATHPGACHELEIEWGQWVRKLIPSAEKLRFVGSGTEATLMAVRLARMHTGRKKILKFAGHFHGWHDYLMLGVDDPAQTTLPGVPEETSSTVVIIPPNDPELVEETLRSDPDIAGVILEPTGGHWGHVPIGKSFLQALREITTRHKCVLIFDEVITGFRASPGGAQALHGVTPDLTTLAKILAGGLPGGCCVGRVDIMDHVQRREHRPKMPHPGTFNANPVSAAAGIATLKLIATGKPTARANEVASQIRTGLNAEFESRGWKWFAYGANSGFRLIPDYEGPRSDVDGFVPHNGDFDKLNWYPSREMSHAFRRAMLLRGVDVFGLSGMTTSAHTDEDVAKTVRAILTSLARSRINHV